MKRILSFFLTLVLTAALLSPAALAVNETAAKDRDWVYITLDPGHGGDGAGGNDSGAVNEKYGYQEADLVLKIGLYLKEELETYRNVHVDMTRSDRYGTRYTPLREVKQRVDFAAEQCSDLLVSLHLNSAGSNQSVHGGLILASNGNYDPDCAKVIDAVGTNILAQLSRLGIDTSRGLVKEGSHDGTLYPNGKLADYYGIVRYGQLRHIPAMIVEHCFVSSNSDCEQFLSSDAKLRAIAQADARGIAAYYGLEKKDPGEVDVEPLFRDCRSHWAKDYVNRAADAGWVNGVGGGLFQPDGTLTRAMFVTMLAGLSGVDEAHVLRRFGGAVVRAQRGLGRVGGHRLRHGRRAIRAEPEHHAPGDGADHGRLPCLEGRGHAPDRRSLGLQHSRPCRHRPLGARQCLFLL